MKSKLIFFATVTPTGYIENNFFYLLTKHISLSHEHLWNHLIIREVYFSCLIASICRKYNENERERKNNSISVCSYSIINWSIDRFSKEFRFNFHPYALQRNRKMYWGCGKQNFFTLQKVFNDLRERNEKSKKIRIIIGRDWLWEKDIRI